MPKNLLQEFKNKMQQIEEKLSIKNNFSKKPNYTISDNIEVVDLDLELDFDNPQPDYSYSYAMNMLNKTESFNDTDYLKMINNTFATDEIKKIASDINEEE